MNPYSIKLTQDYLDLETGIAYPAGTILYRQPSGQYAVKGTGLGGECLYSLSALKEGDYDIISVN